MKSMGIALSFFIETIVIFVCVCVWLIARKEEKESKENKILL